MGNLETSHIDCLNFLKQKHGFSDNDLSNLLGISKNAIVSNNISEQGLNAIKLLEAILIKEGVLNAQK